MALIIKSTMSFLLQRGFFFPVDQRFLNVLPIFFKNSVTLHLREVYLRVAKLRVVFMRMFRRSLRVAISHFTRFFLFYVALEEKEISTISRFFILQRFIACTNAKLAKKICNNFTISCNVRTKFIFGPNHLVFL